MILGFLVTITEKGEKKQLTVKGNIFSVGSDYKNSVVLPILPKEVKLLEIRDNSLLLYQQEGVIAKIHANNSVYDLNELLKLFPKSNVIKLKSDCEITFLIGDFEIHTKVSEIEDVKTKPLPQNFKKRLLTKENIKFIGFTSLITLVFFLITGIAAFQYTKNKVTIKPIEVTKDEQLREIGYTTVDKKKKFTETAENDTGQVAAKNIKEKKKISEPSVPSGAFIASAPQPELTRHGGVLAVQEGAKSVIIKKERSLFSKLEETLEEPIVKKEAKATPDDTKKTFQSAKVEDIHPGPEKKDVKVELESAAKLKVQERVPEAKVVVGKRPEAEITSSINKYKKGFEFIFIEERKKDSNLKGKVVIFFVVDNSGAVTKAEIYETDIKNKEFLNKILMLVKSIKFPPTDKGDTSIKLPLLFFPS